MRIAHLAAELVPTSSGVFVGGLAKSVSTLALGQTSRGHAVEIFTSDVNHSLRDGESKSGMTFNRVETLGRYGSPSFAASFVLNAARKLMNVNRHRPFDIVHVHSAYVAFGAIGYLLAPVESVKIFSLYSPNFGLLPGHNCLNEDPYSRLALTRWSLRSFDCITVPSDNLKRKLQNRGIAEQSVVRIPPCIDPAMQRPFDSREDSRQILGIPPDSKVVLFVGNYSEWKGAEVLLQSIGELTGELPEIKILTAWGEPYKWSGNQKERIDGAIKRLNLERFVYQMGIVDDIRTLFYASDVLAAPFKCTCMVLDLPLTILEAMICGRPVISTSVGGIPEILGKNERGIIVQPGDKDELAVAVRTLVQDEVKRERIAIRGRDWVLSNMSPECVQTNMESLYNSLRHRATTTLRDAPAK